MWYPRPDFISARASALESTETSKPTWKVTAKQNEAESHGKKNHIYQESAGCRVSKMELAYSHQDESHS
jgi:hypothetical protein